MLKLFLIVGLSIQVQARSQGALTTELKEQSFHATVKSGFHFNDKAPNSVTLDDKIIKPTRLAGREAEFTGLPKEWSAGKAALYICDDAVTFCEPHFIELKGGKSKPATLTGASKNKGKVNSHGFIEDDFNKALELAKKQKKLVLIDFSARWCPGCLRLENETFNTKDFKNLTKNFVKLKIDVDRFENIVLSEKFKIKGIPTLLVVNSNQDEVDRVYDYQPPDTLERFFTGINKDPATIIDLTDKAKTGDQGVNLRLGQRLLAASRFEESVSALSKVQPVPAELVQAKIEMAAARFKSDKTTKAQYEKELREAIKAEPSSSRSLTWRTSLLTLIEDKSEKKKIVAEGSAIADALLADKEKLKAGVKDDLVGEFTGYEPFLVSMYKADLIGAAEEGDVALSAWKETAEVGRSLNISAKKTGVALRYLLILIQAKNFDEADKLSLAILKNEPNNGDVQRRRLKVLVEQRRFNEAILLGEKCIKNSYGRNEFWVAESLAKAYIGADQPKSAKALLDRYLSRTDIEWSNLQGPRKNMQDLRQKLPATI